MHFWTLRHILRVQTTAIKRWKHCRGLWASVWREVESGGRGYGGEGGQFHAALRLTRYENRTGVLFYLLAFIGHWNRVSLPRLRCTPSDKTALDVSLHWKQNAEQILNSAWLTWINSQHFSLMFNELGGRWMRIQIFANKLFPFRTNGLGSQNTSVTGEVFRLRGHRSRDW